LTPPRFDSRTVQSIASGYTEYTVVAQLNGAWNTTPWPLHFWERKRIHIVQEAGRVPGSVWASAKNLDTSEIRFSHCPVHSKWLYRIHCCGPTEWGMEHHVLATSLLGKRTDTHCTGGWAVPSISLDECRKS